MRVCVCVRVYVRVRPLCCSCATQRVGAVQLTRKNPREYRALADEAKALLTHGIDNVLSSMADDVKQLGAHEQQILLLEISQVGAIFTGPDWREHCPDVPVDLLNKLLDSVVASIKSLKGSQVGMVLFSLHKLQLRDPRAFAHISDCITEQLNAPGRNSWYKNTDALSKLISGIVMCSVVRDSGCVTHVATKPASLPDRSARVPHGTQRKHTRKSCRARLIPQATGWLQNSGLRTCSQCQSTSVTILLTASCPPSLR